MVVSALGSAGVARADEARPEGAGPAATAPASPEPSAPPPASPRKRTIELRYNLWIDGGISLALAAGMISWTMAKPGFPKRTCTICDGPGTETNALDDAFRTAFRRDDIGPAASVSHVISYGLSPAVGTALVVGVAAADSRASEAPVNALLVIEASLTASVVKEMITFAIRRERPEVHGAVGEAKEVAMTSQSDPMESFPSGHVMSIMAITSSSAVIATMRGYRLAPLIWIVGSTMAATVTYLRMASDQHYFTDNIVGAALGTGIGAAIPLLFHGPVKPKDDDHGSDPARGSRGLLGGATLTTTPVQGGRVVNIGWLFF